METEETDHASHFGSRPGRSALARAADRVAYAAARLGRRAATPLQLTAEPCCA